MSAAVQREVIRDFLGINKLLDRIEKLESIMATAREQLDAVSAKVDTLVGDVRAELDILRQQQGNLDAEGQGALDRLSAKIDAFDAEVKAPAGGATPPPSDQPAGDGTV